MDGFPVPLDPALRSSIYHAVWPNCYAMHTPVSSIRTLACISLHHHRRTAALGRTEDADEKGDRVGRAINDEVHATEV